MTVIDDYFDAQNFTYTKRQETAAELLRMYKDAKASVPPADYTGCYAADDANNLYVVGNLIKRGSNLGVGGTTVRFRGAGLASLIYEDNAANIGDIQTDPDYAAVNMIRLPIIDTDGSNGGWDQRTDSSRLTYWNNTIQPCIDLCIANGKDVILDYHAVKDWDTDDRYDKAYNFWAFAVERIRNNPRVMIEMFNEPVNPSSYPWPSTSANWLLWQARYQNLVNFIRYRCRNIIIVGGPAYSSRTIWAQTLPFAGDNLVYTMHAYPNFTGGLRDYLAMPETAASTKTLLVNATPTNVPVMFTEGGWSTSPEISGETALSNDVNYPEGLRQYLVDTKNAHFTFWAKSTFGLGTDNSSGADMKAWVGDNYASFTV